MVFQDEQLFPHRDVAANVGFGLRMQGVDAATRRRRVDELLALVGLTGFGTRHVTDLSGGEAKRVALARSLAPSPRRAAARRAAHRARRRAARPAGGRAGGHPARGRRRRRCWSPTTATRPSPWPTASSRWTSCPGGRRSSRRRRGDARPPPAGAARRARRARTSCSTTTTCRPPGTSPCATPMAASWRSPVGRGGRSPARPSRPCSCGGWPSTRLAGRGLGGVAARGWSGRGVRRRRRPGVGQRPGSGADFYVRHGFDVVGDGYARCRHGRAPPPHRPPRLRLASAIAGSSPATRGRR